MKIRVWSDFACPFCWLGETQLSAVAAERGLRITATPEPGDIELEFHAYELDPQAPATPTEDITEHFMKAHSLDREAAEAQIVRITKMAARAGLDYHLPGVKVCSTFDAHRLMKYALAHGGGERMLRLNHALFKANFEDNELLSDRSVLERIARSCGYDGEDVRRMLASDEYTAEVRADEAAAEASDLELIPYLRFADGRVLQGAFSRTAVRRALDGESS